MDCVFVLIKSTVFILLSVWILLKSAGSHSCFRFYFKSKFELDLVCKSCCCCKVPQLSMQRVTWYVL